MRLTLGSLASGVGGLEVGVERALDAHTIWQCEIDRHASTILARHWPGVPNLDDLTTVNWTQIKTPDVLVAGPPCQPVSSAGKGLGRADDRWLWDDVLHVVAELRPAWCLLENPARLLTGSDRDEDDDADCDPFGRPVDGTAVDPSWFGAILGTLAGLGYDTEWCCLRSCDVGAPHRRKRVFLAAYTHGARTGRDGRPVPRAATQDRRAGVVAHAAVADRRSAANTTHDGRDRTGQPRRRGSGPLHRDDAAADTAGPRSRPGDVEPYNGAGPGGRRTPQSGRRGSAAADADGERRHRIADTADNGTRREQPDPTGRGPVDWGRYTPAVRRWEAIHGPAPRPLDDRGRLNPDLSRWMLGFPPGWVDGIPRTAQLRVLGNSAQPQVAELAARLLLAPVQRLDVDLWAYFEPRRIECTVRDENIRWDLDQELGGER